MTKANLKIKINNAAVKEIDRNVQLSLEQTADALLTEVKNAQVMPRKTGHLQNDSTFVDASESKNGKVTIVSNTPYARRLYFHPEYNFRKTENANAKGLWYEDWTDGDKKDFVEQTFAELLKRNGGF